MGAADDSGGKGPKAADPALSDTHLASASDPLAPILRKLAHAPAARTLNPGQSVGRFELLRELGHGGFGVVYEARDRELGRKVALKMMASAAGREAEQALAPLLRREAATAARLNHPNIVTLHDLGMFEGAPYLVLELLEGETLAQRLARGPLPPGEAARIAIEVARGLVHAHGVGVIHRDLKPSNVFLTRDGAVKVLDLGLARLAAAVETIRSTMVPEAALSGAGTPAYMAPEQWRGEAGDERTDVFSLGVTMFEMIAGRLPFDVAGKGKTALLDDTPAPAAPNAPPALATTLATALAKDPAQRFQTADGMLAALLDAEGHAPGRARRWLAAAAVLALIAGGLYLARTGLKTPAGARLRKSVAVLGFKNLSGRSDAAWISTALGETLSTELALGDRLRTVPGEKVARAKNDLAVSDADGFELDTLSRLRRHLGTDYVVLGSYLPSGGTLRVDVRLQDAQTGETVAQMAENGTENDLVNLVGRIGGRLRDKLGAGELSATETALVRQALPGNPEAARLYSEGLDRARQFDFVAARALLERAAAAEPDSPLAPAALVDVYSGLGLDVQMRAAAKRAFELSSGLSREGRLAIEARYRRTVGETAKAIEIYKTLADFYPDNVEYGLKLGAAQVEAGRSQEAVALAARLRKLPRASDDPRIDLLESNATPDMKRAIALAQDTAHKAEAQGARLLVAQAMQQEASALMWSGDFEHAIELAQRSRPIFEAAGNQYGVAQSLFPIAASLEQRDDDLPKTIEVFEQQLAIFRKSGMRAWQALKLGDIAFGQLSLGDTAAARKVLDEATAIAREIGDPQIEHRTRTIVGWMLFEQGDLEGAREPLESWLRENSDPAGGTSEFIVVLGWLWIARGESAKARDLLAKQVQFDEKQTQSWDLAAVRAIYSRALIEEGRLTEAETIARRGLDDLQKLKILGGMDDPLDSLARALIAQGKLDEAAQVLEKMRNMKCYQWNHRDHIDVDMLGAWVRALREGAPAIPEALETIERSQREAVHWHLGEPELEARLYLGQLELKAGRTRSGRTHLAALARDARARGFVLIARKAAAASR